MYLSCVFSWFFNGTETVLYVYQIIFFLSWAYGKMYFPDPLQLGSMLYHQFWPIKNQWKWCMQFWIWSIKSSHPQSSFLLTDDRCWSVIHGMEIALSLSSHWDLSNSPTHKPNCQSYLTVTGEIIYCFKPLRFFFFSFCIFVTTA